MFCLPLKTHRYLIEPVSNSIHPKVMLSSRYVTFCRSLLASSKLSVRILARLCERDRRTVLGRTLDALCRECGVSDITKLSSNLVKAKLNYHRVNEEDDWRIKFVAELLQLRAHRLSIPGFTMEEIKDMLTYTCIS